MKDDELNTLMEELFRAQAYKCELSAGDIYVNAEGSLQRTTVAMAGVRSLPTRMSGLAMPKRVGNSKQEQQAVQEARPEIKKKIPRETLASGGRFVAITTASKNGLKGVSDRKAYLVGAAKKLGLPTDKIHVFGSEILAKWCNHFPRNCVSVGGKSRWTMVIG